MLRGVGGGSWMRFLGLSERVNGKSRWVYIGRTGMLLGHFLFLVSLSSLGLGSFGKGRDGSKEMLTSSDTS